MTTSKEQIEQIVSLINFQDLSITEEEKEEARLDHLMGDKEENNDR